MEIELDCYKMTFATYIYEINTFLDISAELQILALTRSGPFVNNRIQALSGEPTGIVDSGHPLYPPQCVGRRYMTNVFVFIKRRCISVTAQTLGGPTRTVDTPCIRPWSLYDKCIYVNQMMYFLLQRKH